MAVSTLGLLSHAEFSISPRQLEMDRRILRIHRGCLLKILNCLRRLPQGKQGASANGEGPVGSRLEFQSLVGEAEGLLRIIGQNNPGGFPTGTMVSSIPSKITCGSCWKTENNHVQPMRM